MRRLFVVALSIAAFAACTHYDTAEPPAGKEDASATPLDAGIETRGPDASTPGPSDASSSPDVVSDGGGPAPATCRGKREADGTCDPLVFVTAQTFAGGTILGVQGADRLCTAAAGSGQFVAWLSDSTVTALSRVSAGGHTNRPLYRADGVMVTASIDALASSMTLIVPIDRTIDGETIPPGALVWTGTPRTGPPSSTCVSWTSFSSTQFGVAGQIDGTGSYSWTITGESECTQMGHLYCFEIPP